MVDHLLTIPLQLSHLDGLQDIDIADKSETAVADGAQDFE